MTKAQQSLLAIHSACGPQFRLTDIKHHGLDEDFRRALRAGLIQPAGYEISVAGDDFIARSRTL